MDRWLESIYSDGTDEFVSSPSPALFETVTVRLRMYGDTPVTRVVLRAGPNGGEALIPMTPAESVRGLIYYEAPLRVNQRRLGYHFILICKDAVYFYNQRGITTCRPDENYDFVLLTDYVQPSWVREAVFYQIFPDRFYNGDPANDVASGEYAVDGHPTIRVGDWNAAPLPYEKGFCLDFYGGDLRGVREKLPYLKALGVTAVYLNPIFTAPSVHKYDCVDYLEVDPHLGGDEALAELSAALHENGMRLILDISINHTGSAHKWFNRDALWFPKDTGAYPNPGAPERSFYFFGEGNSYQGWWDVPTLPVLNYTSEALRDMIYRHADSVLKKWLRPPYSIDGWRFDVANVFGRNDDLQLSHELWPEIRRSIREENPEAYILAEDWGDCAEHLQGGEWDAPMNYYGCGRVIRQFVGEPELFLAREGLLDGVAYKMTAQDLKDRVLTFLAKLPHVIRENMFNLIDSHDVSRLHNDPAIHPEEYRGAVIFQFTLPGAPSIYYGDEAAVGGTLGTNEGCRWPMPWDTDIAGTGAYKLHAALARLRREHAALTRGGMMFLYADGYIAAIARFYRGEVFVSVISASERDETIRLPLAAAGASEPDGSADALGAPLIWSRLDDKAVELTVPAHKAYIFRCI